jgi:rhomboid family GlyGly-CTERM serine protease
MFFPWITALLAGLAFGVFAFDLGESLETDPALVARGEVWRVFTGHLAHWNGSHLFWDTLVLVALGAVCERADRTTFLLGIGAASLVIGCLLPVLAPTTTSYRGLSGIDSALFALLAIQGRRAGNHRWLGVAALVAFAVKCLWEWWTATPVFVENAIAGMVPVPAAHVAGAVCGVLTGTVSRLRTVSVRGKRD